ncbi:amino acid/amide ABC transporter membrane protein 2 (HAAT family) /amino acid/amide ABC transporter ATP-binding protein 1 (HAAT family) [Pseudacidovorax intermedius]|uniref:Amino acid/amide ABC transporter membrane protein 2 (HAAT family) /amino acid/amide ABC transporter ATP-binding protein 1 (HAAT family) n=2 Tax=Pseudacidovorax intermedius TaxID=433924 RepID=A0A370FLM4_9BURK|nr:ATP-binding cassette domain-containing protein [Pseudacidovorax intermedius]RDI28596.1 amino acid/amide ABC transporter membrane protein 2 (HAAT family) /amino acid/amide ABC transporter ATP-binding protein 1 (HAAT family) [Pseudacidovorax intermedius]
MDSLLAADPARPDIARRGPAALGRLGGFAPAAVLAAGLGVLPLAGNDFLAYQVALFLIYGIATQGVALCWGRLGFLPLGHALYFGLGAYLAGGALKAGLATPTGAGALAAALLLPALLAWVVARLLFARSLRSGPYFSLITLAMAMLGSLAALQWSSVTGGFNGLGDIPELPGLDRFGHLYWLVAAAAVLSTGLLGLWLRRPLGTLWSGIAQSEDRMQLFGYATDRIKAKAYALSALLASVAGVLFAAHQGIVTPQAMGFVLSTEFVIWAAVGGKASPLGAMLGAVAVGWLSSELRDAFAYWEVAVGLLFIAVVRFLPEGLAGLAARWTDRWLAPSPARPVPAPPSASPAGVPALRFDAVRCSQSGVRILDGLSLSLQGPGIRAVIGPNGAGKTSAFNAMTGRLPVRGGTVRLGKADITGLNAWRVARHGVGRKLQIPSVFPALSVAQNLQVALWAGRLAPLAALGAAPLGWHTPLLHRLLARFPELQAQQALPAGQLSQGQRQALELVMTLLPEPRLVLLDEPCAGLSPAETHRMIDVIREAVHELDAAALLIEHDLAAVAALGGDVLVLHQGRLLAHGPMAAIQADPAVRAVYAGARK